jgi:pimeloyl-ACP methyl ester carboxylesterase
MIPARPEPFFFGPKDRPLFGWLHNPAGITASSVGLVICNPFGYEAICAHKTLRHLAQAAAGADVPALRFDYDGTGDSAGNELDAERVPAWIDSIGQAVDALKEKTGLTRICLFGVRLGATLALLAAARRSDIVGTIAMAPVINARSYVRELRALSFAMRQIYGPSDQPDAGSLETAGFLLSAQTQTALKEIDLTRLERAPCPRMLVLARNDMPPNDSWTDKLRHLGVDVEQRSVAGYVEMMLDAHESVVPEQMVHAAAEWLRAIDGSCPSPTRWQSNDREASEVPTHTPRPAARVPNSVTFQAQGGSSLQPGNIEETALFIGTDAELFGITSRPAQVDSARPGFGGTVSARPRKCLGILLLNAGAVPHVGPNRLYVELARQWAAMGHTVLRMDLSGIGDSPARSGEPENVVYSSHASIEVRSALEFLRRDCLVTNVYALGLCSGGYHGFKTAVAGAPLAGVVLVNPLTFFWKDGMSLQYPEFRVAADIARYRTNVLRADSWRKLLGGKVDLRQLSQVLLRQLAASISNGIRTIARGLNVPLREDLGSELLSLAAKSTGIVFVFAANDPGLELLKTQGGSVARRLLSKGRLVVHIIDGADHTFTQRAARDRLTEILTAEIDRETGRGN